MAFTGGTGERHGLGGPRQRLVLATLVSREGRAVTTDELVSAVWGDDPPESAGATLQSYASRLRSLLGADSVIGGQGTYALLLARDDVDLWSLVDTARAVDVASRSLLERAVRAWQGLPYDDLTHETALAASVAAASDAYLTVTTELAQRLLDADQPDDASAVLKPAHEQFRDSDQVARLLMVTCTRMGRPLEAARAFRVMRGERRRRRLPEPEAQTVQLLEVILASHPGARAALTLPPRSIAETGTASLPTPATTFIGRRRDVDAVHDLVRSRPWVSIVGPPGVGKSRLSIEVGWRWARHSPEQCVYVDLTGTRDALVALSGALGVADEPAASRAATLRHALRARGATLLVLDGVEALDDAAVGELHSILRSLPHVSTLATCHAALGTSWECCYPLQPLSLPHDSTELMRSAAGRLLVERVRTISPGFTLRSTWDDDLVRITHLLDGLPLALELVAAEVAQDSPRQVAARVHQGQATFAALDASIDSALRPLTPTAHDVLDVLSTTIGRVPEPLAASLAQTRCSSPSEGQAAVQVLVHQHLLTADETGVRMPDVIRAHTRRRLHRNGRWPSAVAAHHRVVDSLLTAAYTLVHTRDQGIGGAQVLPVLDEIEHAVRRRPDESARLVAMAAPWLYRAGEYRRLIAWADVVTTHSSSTDQPALARCLGFAALAHASAEHDRSRAASLADDAVARAASCDAATLRSVRLLRGDVRTVLGDYTGARADLEQVLVDDPLPWERALAGLRLLRVRWASRDDARGDAAERSRRRLAVDIDRCGDPALVAYHRLTLGSREQHDGRLRRARGHYLDALALLRDLEHRTFERIGVVTMADLDAMQGRWDAAADAAIRLVMVGHSSAAGFPRHPQEILARAYAERGDVDLAHDALAQVVHAAERQGHLVLATAGHVQRAWLWYHDHPDRALSELDLVPARELPMGLTLDVTSVRAACLARVGRLDESLRLLRDTRHVAPKWPLLVERLRRALVEADVALSAGAPVVALRALDDADEKMGESGYVLRTYERLLHQRTRRRLTCC